jgi:translation initiation factor 4G
MTTATDVRIVPATREHIPFVAWVVHSATRSHLPRSIYDFTVSKDEAEILRYLEIFADTETVHWGHWSQFLIAEVDGVPAAGLAGFSENELGIDKMFAGAIETNAKFGITAEEWARRWEKAKSFANLAHPHEPGAWVVEHVATHPDFRRRGLIERLMHEMLDRGRRRGAKTAEIGVLIGNDGAQRAYEKCGFEVFVEIRDAEFEAVFKCPGGYLLHRAI